MGYAEVYGGLLKEIAEEADAIALRYFAETNCALTARAMARQ